MNERLLTPVPEIAQSTVPAQSPEAANRARKQAEEAERSRLIEKQLDTEELLAGLGAVGIGRLRHPFRTARILAVAAKRQYKGEYSPRLTLPTDQLLPNRSPFEDHPLDELSDARTKRAMRVKAEQERSRLQAGEVARGPWKNSLEGEAEGNINPYTGKPYQESHPETPGNPFED